MRVIRLPKIDWDNVVGAKVVVPVKVDWPELRLTDDQVFANVLADLDNRPRPYPDHSFIEVVIER